MNHIDTSGLMGRNILTEQRYSPNKTTIKETEEKLLSILMRDNKYFNIIMKYRNIFITESSIKLLDIISKVESVNHDYNYLMIADYILVNKNFFSSDLSKIQDKYFDTCMVANFYLEILIKEYLKRTLQTYLKTINGQSAIEIKVEVEKIIQEVQTPDEAEIEDGKKEYVKIVENLQANLIEEKVYSGFEKIQENNDGYDKTDYVLIGGQESVGKTSFVMSLIQNQIMRKNMSIGFFSCEMPKKKIFLLMACMVAGVNPKLLQKNLIKTSEKDAISKALVQLYEKKLYVYDSTRNWQEIKDKAIIMKKKYNIECLYIDYLHYLRLPGVNQAYERLEIISAESKSLAKELNIPVVEVVALNRTGKNIEPENSHIKGNGDIEYHADIIFLLWTINYAVDGEFSKRDIGIKVSKNRNGELSKEYFTFRTDIKRFEKSYNINK